jgi:hypothetical protein
MFQNSEFEFRFRLRLKRCREEKNLRNPQTI